MVLMKSFGHFFSICLDPTTYNAAEIHTAASQSSVNKAKIKMVCKISHWSESTQAEKAPI